MYTPSVSSIRSGLSGLSQGTDEAIVAENEDADRDDEAERDGDDVVRHLEPAVDDQPAVLSSHTPV